MKWQNGHAKNATSLARETLLSCETLIDRAVPSSVSNLLHTLQHKKFYISHTFVVVLQRGGKEEILNRVTGEDKKKSHT